MESKSKQKIVVLLLLIFLESSSISANLLKLKIVNDGPNQLKLRWNSKHESIDTREFRVTVNNILNSDCKKPLDETPAECIVGNLEPNENYTMQLQSCPVGATDLTHCQSASEPTMSFTTPKVPEGFSIENVGNTSLDVSWETPDQNLASLGIFAVVVSDASVRFASTAARAGRSSVTVNRLIPMTKYKVALLIASHKTKLCNMSPQLTPFETLPKDGVTDESTQTTPTHAPEGPVIPGHPVTPSKPESGATDEDGNPVVPPGATDEHGHPVTPAEPESGATDENGKPILPIIPGGGAGATDEHGHPVTPSKPESGATDEDGNPVVPPGATDEHGGAAPDGKPTPSGQGTQSPSGSEGATGGSASMTTSGHAQDEPDNGLSGSKPPSSAEATKSPSESEETTLAQDKKPANDTVGSSSAGAAGSSQESPLAGASGSSQGSNKLNGGQIAGIVIGVLMAGSLVVGTLCILNKASIIHF